MKRKKTGRCSPPKTVYKYVDLRTAKLILNGGTLQWCSPFAFNDPFDMRWYVGWQFEGPQAIKELRVLVAARVKNPAAYPIRDIRAFALAQHIEEWYKNDKVEFERIISRYGPGIGREAITPAYETQSVRELKQLRIICFSEEINSILMWSHYSRSHRGIVLEFDARKVAKANKSECHRVRYRNGFPPIANVKKWVRCALLGGKPKFFKSLRDNTLHTKAKVWSYEKEIRLVADQGRNPRKKKMLFPFPADALKSVTLGADSTKREEKAMTAILAAKYPGVKLRKAKTSDTTFRIEVA